MSNFTFTTKPRDYQLAVFEQTKDLPFYAIFWDMGLGKSKLVLDTACYLHGKHEITTLVVIAPKGGYAGWHYEEAPLHLPRNSYKSMLYRSGMGVKASKEMQDFTRLRTPLLKILCINVEALSSASGERFILDFCRHNLDCLVVVDESTCIKNPKAKRSKVAYRLKGASKYRRILSGTPMDNSPLDMYGQAEFLASGMLGSNSYLAFERDYAVTIQRQTSSGQRYHQLVGYRDLDRLKEHVAQFASRLTKDECLDLPEKVYVTRDVELTPEQSRAYNNLRDIGLALLDDGSLVTQQAAANLLARLRRIVYGHLVTDTKELMDIKHNRIDVLRDTLEEIGWQKTIVWCAFRRDIENIAKAFPDKVVTYYGETKDRQGAVEAFRNDENRRLFVSNEVGAKALNLASICSHELFYSHWLDTEARTQAEDRIYRIGQTKTTTVVEMLSRGTVDEKICLAHRNKRALAGDLLSELRALLR